MNNSAGNEASNGKNVYVKPIIDEGDALPGAAAFGLIFTPAIVQIGED